MKRENFISKVVDELLLQKFSIFLHQKKRVDKCGGWFDKNKKEFMVAIKNPMGFEILIHEYSHFLQWRDKRRYFNKFDEDVDIVFSWLEGKDFSQKRLLKAFRGIVELELDCEQGAVNLIKKYNLEVDLDKYIRAANAYLLFYQMLAETRVWPEKSPYNTVAMRRLMPPDLQSLDYYFDKSSITTGIRTQYNKIFNDKNSSKRG